MTKFADKASTYSESDATASGSESARSSRERQRIAPAPSAKIVTAGITTTAVLGLVALMGAASRADASEQSVLSTTSPPATVYSGIVTGQAAAEGIVPNGQVVVLTVPAPNTKPTAIIQQVAPTATVLEIPVPATVPAKKATVKKTAPGAPTPTPASDTTTSSSR